MTVFDDARQAGFSDEEISDWVNSHREDAHAAGFTDQEIDREFTGMKNPRQVPPNLMARMGGALREGFMAGFGEGPITVPPEQMQKAREAFKESPIGLTAVDEAVIQATHAGVSLLMRTLNGATMGVGAYIGQGMAEWNHEDETEQARARRDTAQLVNIGAMLLGSTIHAPVIGPAGRLPRAADFTDAARAIGEGHFSRETRQALVDAYEDHGVLPGEAAAHAQMDPAVAKAFREGRVPDRYSGKSVLEPVEEAPEPPKPPREPTEIELEPFDHISPDGIPVREYGLPPEPLDEGGKAGGTGLPAIRTGVPGEPTPPRPPLQEGEIMSRGELALRNGPPMENGPPPGGIGAPRPPLPTEPPTGISYPNPPPRAPFFTYDDRPGWQKFFSNVLDSYKRTFQPELISDEALKADPLFARYRSRQAAAHTRVLTDAEEYHQFWRGVDEKGRLEYLSKFEKGQFNVELFAPGETEVALKMPGKGPADLVKIADRHQEILSKAYDLEKAYGSKAEYIEEYFPHIWEDPMRARDWIAARRSQLGPTWFQKERHFNLIEEGLAAGLRLKNTNPEDLVTLRLLASADMVERTKLLHDLYDQNLAIKKVAAHNSLQQMEGWQSIIGPDREEWLLSPDIVPLWKNAVEAKGLWANEGAPGTAFRGWMALKNVWVPIKLALSLFHPLHVLHINYTEGFARAWDQIAKGDDPIGAMKSAMEGIYGPMQAAIPGMPHMGKLAREAWKTPQAEWTPAQKAMMSLMHDGGFVPEMSEQLRIAAKRSLERALDEQKWWGVVPLLRRMVEIAQAPIFQEWIPNLKAAAYLQSAQALLARRPELIDNHVQRGVALRTISKQIDDRFGEMFYGGIFWNRYVKDAAIGSFLSLGWQLGFARQFGGALLQPAYRVARKLARGETEAEATIKDAQNKVAYVFTYAMTAAAIGGMMTYAFTGKGPEDWYDYFLPRSGGNNPDGSPRRMTNMFYTREIPQALKHIEARGGGVTGTIRGLGDMLWNKLMFQPIKEMMDNRSYYGADIWEEGGPVWQKAVDAIKHLFNEQFNPMSITGFQRARQMGASDLQASLSFLGFGPAPAYASKTPAQNRIGFLFERYAAPLSRPAASAEQQKQRGEIRTELLMAQQQRNQPALREAVDKWFSAGGSRQGLSNMLLGLGNDIAQFRALPIEIQEQAMATFSPEDQARYRPWQKSNVTNRVADMLVDAQKARLRGDESGAVQLENEMFIAIQNAAKDGHITNKAAFNRAIKQRVFMHYQPEAGAILSLPKAMRPQFTQPQQ